MQVCGSDRPDFCAWVAVTKNVKTATRIDPQERSIGQFDPRKRSKTVNYGPPRGAKWDGVSGASAVLRSGARLQPLEQAPRCGGAPSTSLEHAPH
jgi:hypothetical protein